MTRRWPSILFLILLLVAALLGWRRIRSSLQGVEALVPVVRESRIPLLLRLSTAVQGAGYPEDTDFHQPFLDANRNYDDPGIPVTLPQRGTLLFPDLPVHEAARLTFGYGIEAVRNEKAPGATVTFRVSAVRGGEERRELFEGALVCGAAGSPPLRQSAEVSLPGQWVGERIALEFSTFCDRAMPEASALPVILSPVLHSGGTKVRLEKLGGVLEVVLEDLLDRYEQAIEEDEEHEWISHSTTNEFCFAVAVDEQGQRYDPQPILTSGVTASLDPDTRLNAARGGVRPALFFDWDHSIVRYPVDVPGDGAALRFEIGVDHRCTGVGFAGFLVSIDGEEVFQRELDPERRPLDRGWHECEIDLGPYAGRQIMLGFEGEVGIRNPVQIDLVEPQAVGPGRPYRLEVHRVRGAFARPRIAQRLERQRRLSMKGERPSVVLVNVETFRADAPSCYGGPPDITPALDRLAAEGTLVEECLVSAPWTAPSVASLFTGLYPRSHGVTSYARLNLPESVQTLAERASLEAVTTAAFCSNGLISEAKNFNQGFETFFLAPSANARQLVQVFEDWLADNKDLQFLAYLHLFEPHYPYNAPGEDRDRYVPEELRGIDPDEAVERVKIRLLEGDPVDPGEPDVRLLRARYLGEVRYLDRQIERLRLALAAAGLDGRVVLIVTGDHGEEFLEHGLLGHGSHVYGESIHVPLLFYGPGVIPAGKRISGPVEGAALYSTVLELLDVTYDRQAVRPPIRFDGTYHPGSAYSSTAHGIRGIDAGTAIRFKSIHAMRSAHRSLVYAPPGADPETHPEDQASLELFDLARDPGESLDLSGEQPGIFEELKKLMEQAYALAGRSRHGMDVGEI
ncbi:MAG: sulfatase-like hydrolase/transferase, partial [Planctomycetota bacterium]